jgi:hypothetical protein
MFDIYLTTELPSLYILDFPSKRHAEEESCVVRPGCILFSCAAPCEDG